MGPPQTYHSTQFGPMRFYAHGMPRVKKGQTMSVVLQLGSTPITLKDDEFSNGFQVGYLHFKKDFQEKPVTDELLYTVIAQTAIDVHHTDRCNAGYLVGFFAALLETQPTCEPVFAYVSNHFPQQKPYDLKGGR